MDLTNGLGGTGAATDTPDTVDLTGNNNKGDDGGGDDEDEDVPNLFPGYDDNDYDPSQYEYDYGDSEIRSGGERQKQPGYAFGGRPRSETDSGANQSNGAGGGDNANRNRDEEYSDDNRRGVDAADQARRKGKETDLLSVDNFEPAVYDDEEVEDGGGDDEGGFLEYTELDSEPQRLDDGEGGQEETDEKDEDVKFVSVPLLIEEIGGRGGGSANGISGDPTVIVAGTPPKEEEERSDYDDYDYDGFIQPVTVRGTIVTVGGGEGELAHVFQQSKKEPEKKRRKLKRRRRKKKRVDESDFHAASPSSAFVKKEKEDDKSSSVATSKRISDWSQRLREKRRQRIWRQFRLN